MSDRKTSNRRQFLKNTSVAALSLSFLPLNSKSLTASDASNINECTPVTLDYYGEGPFYTENPPDMDDGQLAKEDEPGTRMIITGRVTNLDCTKIIPGTIIDVWHADDAGDYDNDGYKLRGRTVSNSQGFYMIKTIHPGKYLNGDSYRPSHIHFKITPPDFETLITQLYFEGDSDNATDAAASIKTGEFDASDRIIPLTTNDDGIEEGTWDIVVDGNGVVGVNNIHIDKGMIYKSFPNPFSSRLEINYGVFHNSRISLLVFNMQGQMVATLEERMQSSGKYTAEWIPDSSTPRGYYFISLKVNEMQVHYQKVLLQR